MLAFINAKSAIYFTNKTTRPIYLAIAFHSKFGGYIGSGNDVKNSVGFEGWATISWYNILPGQTREVHNGSPKNLWQQSTFYYYAVTDDGTRQWAGNHNFLTMPNKIDPGPQGSGGIIPMADLAYTKESNPSYEWKGFVEAQSVPIYLGSYQGDPDYNNLCYYSFELNLVAPKSPVQSNQNIKPQYREMKLRE